MKTSVTMTAETRLQWGHPLLNTEGDEIRVPQLVFPVLRQLGLLQRNHDHPRHLYQLQPMTHELLKPEYAGLIGEVRRILGKDLSGPEWLSCNCLTCKRERAEVLRDLVPNWKHVIDRTRPGLEEF